MRLGPDVLVRLPLAVAHEWLLPDGLGGWSSGNAAGIVARRHHGSLLSLDPARPGLVGLDERVVTAGGTFELFSRPERTPNPSRRGAGHQWLVQFEMDPWPCWRWRVGGHLLEKKIRTVYEHAAVAVTWSLLEGPPLVLTASPAIVPPDTAGGDAPIVQAMAGRVRLEFGSAGSLTLWHNGAFLPARASRDHDDDSESLRAIVPGYFEAALDAGQSFHVVASTEPQLFRALATEDRLGSEPPRSLADCVTAIEADDRERRVEWSAAALEGARLTARDAAAARGLSAAEGDERWRSRVLGLVRVLESGLARRDRRRILIGGMPGEERGVEAVRAVAGLIAIRSFDEALAILLGFLEFANEGLIPEGFAPDGTPRYGDPEPTLWLAILAERWARRSERYDVVRETLYPALEEQLRFFRSGRTGIHLADDGLLVTGEGDAAVKPAALNALWYYADIAMSQLARHAGRRESAAFHLAWAREQQRRFDERFWDESSGCLFEAIRGDDPVRGLEPAQLWAAALSPPLLPELLAQALVATIARELVTPLGLRPRPGAGTVEPGWLGPFVSAELRARGHDAVVTSEVRARLEPLFSSLEAGGFTMLPDHVALTEGGSEEPLLAPVNGAHLVSPLAAAELLRAWIEQLAPESAEIATLRE